MVDCSVLGRLEVEQLAEGILINTPSLCLGSHIEQQPECLAPDYCKVFSSTVQKGVEEDGVVRSSSYLQLAKAGMTNVIFDDSNGDVDHVVIKIVVVISRVLNGLPEQLCYPFAVFSRNVYWIRET